MHSSELASAAPSHEDSGLLVQPISGLETIGIIFGTNIGAGVLGMAFAARKTGYVPLLLCLAITCVLCTITMLYLTEVALRTRGNRQLSGLASRYLGGVGGWLLFLAVAANSFGALTAYMAGSGSILLDLLGGYGMSRELGSILFIVPSVAVLYLGLKVLGAGNKVISISMIVIILALIMASIVSQDARLSNLWLSHWQYVVPVFNLAVFVFGAQFLVPELVRGNLTAPRKLPRLIMSGMALTFVFVALIPASVIALVGTTTSPRWPR
jgi:amino acid permease